MAAEETKEVNERSTEIIWLLKMQLTAGRLMHKADYTTNIKENAYIQITLEESFLK